MLYYFSIVGISVCWDVPFPIKITAESVPFQLHVPPEMIDLTVKFTAVAELAKVPENAVYESGAYFSDECVCYCDLPDTAPFACRSGDLRTGKLLFEYVAGYESRFSTSQCIMNYLGFETMLLAHDALLLHSSFIRLVSGCGILFSAPSGTGKSTQAELWRRCRHAEVINGDRAGLKRTNDTWTAWGLPYAGTSGIYRNDSASICAVVALRQSKTNAIRRLNPAQAIFYLYPELTLHRWEVVSVSQAMNLLTDLVSSVPVFLLECRADEDAVSLLENTLKEVI